jgi:hypothetical protein
VSLTRAKLNDILLWSDDLREGARWRTHFRHRQCQSAQRASIDVGYIRLLVPHCHAGQYAQSITSHRPGRRNDGGVVSARVVVRWNSSADA